MQIVDDRGRLFGAINLIDLAVLLFVAVLIPLTYGAYVLFRTPPPRLSAVVPAVLPFAKGVEQRVQVKGEHLRPFLRPKIGGNDARAFLAESPTSGEIRFENVPPGTYDVIVFDEGQEVTRLPQALTILPPPVQLVGWFTDSPAAGARLASGMMLGTADHPLAEVVSVDARGASQRRSATLRVTCRLSPDNRCLVADVPASSGAELTLPIAGTSDRATFHVDHVRADADWLEVKVRLLGLPESLARVRPGDVDTRVNSAAAPPPPPPIADTTTGAIVRSVGSEVLKNQGQYTITAAKPQPMNDITAYGVLSSTLTVDARPADLIVPIERAPAMLYRGTPIRPGNLLEFETPMYRLQALIMSVGKPDHP